MSVAKTAARARNRQNLENLLKMSRRHSRGTNGRGGPADTSHSKEIPSNEIRLSRKLGLSDRSRTDGQVACFYARNWKFTVVGVETRLPGIGEHGGRERASATVFVFQGTCCRSDVNSAT